MPEDDSTALALTSAAAPDTAADQITMPRGGVFIRKQTEREREQSVLNHFWLPYQEKWINDESRNKLCEKTRRCGLTFAEEFRRVVRIVKQGARYDAYITSKDEGLAKQFIRECKAHAEPLKVAALMEGEEVFGKGKEAATAYTLEAATGRRIFSLSSNPDQQAGRAGDRTGDEYALHKDQRQLYAIMKPGTKWGGQLSLFSTHRGAHSYFNTLIKEVREGGNPKKFSLHSIPLTKAVEEGLWIKIKNQLPDDDEQRHWTDDEFLQSCRDEMPDEESFLQEYMCIPEDDADSYIGWELIMPVVSSALGKVDWRTLPGPFYLGYDVARKKDLSVITLMHDVGGCLIQCAMIVLEKTKFSKQREILYSFLDDRRVKVACIDATGLGAQLAEEAAEKYGAARVHEVVFTVQAKQEMAVPFKVRFEERTIAIFDDLKLHADLRSVKKESTSAGNTIFKAESGATDGHADRFWSMALAVLAAEGAGGSVLWQRLKSLVSNTRRLTRRQENSRLGAWG